MSNLKTVSEELWAFLRLLFDNSYRTKEALIEALAAAEEHTGSAAWPFLEMFKGPVLELEINDGAERRRLSDEAARVRQQMRDDPNLIVPSRR